VTSVASGEIASVPCDVFAPCALGGAVRAETVPDLRCRIVCGAANNQLTDAAAGEALHAHGIVYAPDFVVNAGGIINIAGEFSGYDRGRAERQAAAIEQTTAAVFALARERGVSAAAAGELYARERLAALAPLRRRFVPGSRTAWSEGRPLTGLRAH
jgi:glutamate dehydrogenase/leucine dehydrogenase